MASQSEEKLVGHITHYYSHLGVGIIELTHGDLKWATLSMFMGNTRTLLRR